MPDSITIITDTFKNKLEGSRYFVGHLVNFWQELGINIQLSNGCNYIPADLAIMHVDTSVVAEKYLELGHRYPFTLNGGVKDILKTSVSPHLLKKDDAYQGPVIVKTNANYGGINEYLVENASSNSTIPSSFIDRPWRKRQTMDSLNYPVFDSLADVPFGVWRNKRLIVEKFLPERLENGDYKCRVYIFFGEQEFAGWFTSPRPVIKSTVATDMGRIEQIPPELTRLRKSSGFHFGKFDYIEVDGEIFVYDMNKTPAFGAEMIGLMPDGKLGDFAEEIYKFNF
jgi:hypothetical protein